MEQWLGRKVVMGEDDLENLLSLGTSKLELFMAFKQDRA